jgi:capsular exopolysaccharide synthesis family protein
MSNLLGTLIGRKQKDLTVLALNGQGATTPEPAPAHSVKEKPSMPPAVERGESGPVKGMRIVAARPAEAAGDGVSRPPGDEPRGERERWDASRMRVRAARLSAWSPLLSPGDSLSYAAEQYRIVRTKIVQLLDKPFRLVITSPSIGDGKTLTAVNLATAMALKNEGRTLLIDADLRRSNVHTRLDVPLGPGLAEVLSGACPLEEAIFQVQDVPRLHVLTAGQPQGNPTELLDSSRWRALAEMVRHDFAQVIVDCPPVEVVADYDLIAAACDGVTLVVRPDHTDRTRCLAAMSKIGPRLTGVLINDACEWFLWKPVHSGYYYYRKHD